ncbi:MAG: hypothetical protein M3162_04350 [Thermoproteota archaeon]|nr:hypothetical protein [Thermoproteota archaeon]
MRKSVKTQKQCCGIGTFATVFFALESLLTREKHQERIEKVFDFAGIEGKTTKRERERRKALFC